MSAPQDPLDALDYYTLLGVSDEASAIQIRRAFRTFARRYHPDRFVGQSEEKRERAHAIYRRGAEGYQVLTDPVLRTSYDEALTRGTTRMTADPRRAAPAAKKAPPVAKLPIDSVQAQAFFRHAVACGNQSDWNGAWRALKAAVDLEPKNEFLRTRLDQVAARLRARR
jgi:curved DNA-binding protein CbpA